MRSRIERIERRTRGSRPEVSADIDRAITQLLAELERNRPATFEAFSRGEWPILSAGVLK